MSHKKLHWTGERMGDMKTSVHDIQRPDSEYSQKFFSETTEYIPRHNRYMQKESNAIKKQAYKGRYS